MLLSVDTSVSSVSSNNNNSFLTRGIEFRSSNTRLVLPERVTLLVSDDRDSWEGDDITAVILADGYDNVTITGGGGSGGGGDDDYSDDSPWSGGVVNGQGLVWWQNRDDFRPHTVDFKHVTGALIEGIAFRDPPSHCLELYSDHTEVRYVTVTAPSSTGLSDDSMESHNTDAVDVHGSPFWIHHVNFTTGDDNVAIHTSDVLVEASYFGSGHGASIGSLGTEIALTNITIRNVAFNGTTAGFRIKIDCTSDGSDYSLGIFVVCASDNCATVPRPN